MAPPLTRMATVEQYRQAARGRRTASPPRLLQAVEHRPGCRCQEEADRAAAQADVEALWLMSRFRW